eukprot:CAMPEP_0168528614 /NCGR_PEP_ID=MMETSP0405-20121227/13362_1 /TAXON_ID=498012 /ORGANISM="Trichosphaerium sp, Strain Am-I-7 wt" /LENGTH=90 /DNA_ID=CAMNT_0008552069 /DNA_START=56 /DNA_END=325 /DNA_ORIENTATION=+
MAKMINALPEWIVGPEKRNTLEDIFNTKQLRALFILLGRIFTQTQIVTLPRSNLPQLVTLGEHCDMMGYQCNDHMAMPAPLGQAHFSFSW